STQSPGTPPLDSTSLITTGATQAPPAVQTRSAPQTVPAGRGLVRHSPVSATHAPLCTVQASTGAPAVQRGAPGWQVSPRQVPSPVHLSPSSQAVPAAAP